LDLKEWDMKLRRGNILSRSSEPNLLLFTAINKNGRLGHLREGILKMLRKYLGDNVYVLELEKE